MSSDVVLMVGGVWKQYRLDTISHQTLARDFESWWARTRGKDNPDRCVDEVPSISKTGSDWFWALRGRSLDVTRGSLLGIIGRNGAGKSTLLKTLSRVAAPTRGQVKLKGRVASFLEVGTGLHPELTGRENVYLNGAIPRMTPIFLAHRDGSLKREKPPSDR